MWKNLFKFGNKDKKKEQEDEKKIEEYQEKLEEIESHENEEDEITDILENTKTEQISSEIEAEAEKKEENEIIEPFENSETEHTLLEKAEVEVEDKEVEDNIIEEQKIEMESEASDDVEQQNNEVVINEEQIEQKPTKKGFFSRLKEGLSKTRDSINKQIDNVFKAFGKIDEELFEELEEILIMSDVGVDTSVKIIDNLRTKAKERKLTESIELKELLKEEISQILFKEEKDIIPDNGKPTIVLVMGVNGVGKTTTIGKMGYRFSQEGKKVLFAAADTFRAAAIDQLEVWSKRSGVDIIKHNEGSDPAAVIFDAIKAAKARKTDILICDTAGRLHNKKNLMEELKKISRIIDREYAEANKEVFLVLDSTTGQNALNQAKIFSEVSEISGIVLTKLDGTAKGGIVIAIKDQMDIPVKFIGVGEKMYDLQEFNPQDFVDALFEE